MDDLRFLFRLLGKDEPWAYTVVTAVLLSDALLARGMVKQAARALARAAAAYNGLASLSRSRGRATLPAELRAMEERCRRVLDGFEPPIEHGTDPVRRVRLVARSLKRVRGKRTPRETIDALDAVITAGRGVRGPALETRVVQQIARMLGARVLFHHVRGRYISREPQSVHTLSAWTMHRLATSSGMHARRVRPRPEFWRPEQRRPRGVMTIPIGAGRAALARGKPFDNREVRAVRTILRFLDERREGTASRPPARPRKAPARPARAHGLVGDSPAWQKLLGEVWRFGPTTCSVVVRGETGTGKELVARALHMNSERAQGPFVAVNCGTLAGDTMLAELFGHVRGAFTGADRSRVGLLRQAHRGTLFLDEVADLPHATQIAFLRALQERSVRPVGSAHTRSIDVRVVTATQIELGQLVAQGTFREDLMHRLQVAEIVLPPLRARREDLPALCRHLLARHGQAERRITPDAAARLAAHPWPGNVRELENTLRAACVLADGHEIDAAAVAAALTEHPRTKSSSRPNARLEGPRTRRLLALLSADWWSAPDLARALSVSTRTVNRDLEQLVAQRRVRRDGAARATLYRAR